MISQNKTNRIVALVGLCGSGKTSSMEILESKGFIGISVDSLIDSELNKKNIEDSDLNRRNMRNEFKTLYGKDALISLLFERIDSILEMHDVVLDGLYSWDEYLSLKKKYKSNLLIIHVFSSKEKRYERLSIRKYRPISRVNAENRDLNEIENLNKGGPIAFADYILLNDFDIEDLHKEINKLLLKIKN